MIETTTAGRSNGSVSGGMFSLTKRGDQDGFAKIVESHTSCTKATCVADLGPEHSAIRGPGGQLVLVVKD